MPHLYRKKPVVVEARQFKGGEENGKQLCLWMNRNFPNAQAGWVRAIPAGVDFTGRAYPGDPELIVFKLPNGDNYAVNVTDWIIQSVEGPFYTCSAGAFPHVYEKI